MHTAATRRAEGTSQYIDHRSRSGSVRRVWDRVLLARLRRPYTPHFFSFSSATCSTLKIETEIYVGSETWVLQLSSPAVGTPDVASSLAMTRSSHQASGVNTTAGEDGQHGAARSKLKPGQCRLRFSPSLQSWQVNRALQVPICQPDSPAGGIPDRFRGSDPRAGAGF